MPLLPDLLLNDSKSTIDLIMGRKLWGLDQCTKIERGIEPINQRYSSLRYLSNP